MASGLYSEDLSCSVCLDIFTDPVTLLCGHSFCRQCITGILSTQHKCPLCLTAVPGTCPPTSLILKSLAERAKRGERNEGPLPRAEVAELCPEHEEKLKLFCVTDQQLACIICRDGERHEGHKFKPIKEAAASVRRELEAFVEKVSDDISAVESLASTQREEITKTKGKSQQLMTLISTQFKAMHQFLRKREDEIRKDLKNKEEEAVEDMSDTLNAMETALSENRELEGKVTSVLTITDSEKFLKSWTEENSMRPDKHSLARGRNLQVVTESLSLGPYESHLQFFMWKEMLQVIHPRPEELSLKTNSRNITVSEDGRSLMYRPNIIQHPSYSTLGWSSSCHYCGSYDKRINHSFSEDTSVRHASVFSSNSFTSGQHYWEIEVGKRDYWKIGVTNSFLSYDKPKYMTSSENTELTVPVTLQKIGIYLDCQAKELSFYDAEHMTLIHTIRRCSMETAVSAYLEYKFSQGADHNPPRVCWF